MIISSAKSKLIKPVLPADQGGSQSICSSVWYVRSGGSEWKLPAAFCSDAVRRAVIDVFCLWSGETWNRSGRLLPANLGYYCNSPSAPIPWRTPLQDSLGWELLWDSSSWESFTPSPRWTARKEKIKRKLTIKNHAEVLPTVQDPEGSAHSLLLLMKFKNESIGLGRRKCIKKLKT